MTINSEKSSSNGIISVQYWSATLRGRLVKAEVSDRQGLDEFKDRSSIIALLGKMRVSTLYES